MTRRHDANPRNQRIKHEGERTRELRSDRKYAGLVKQQPQFRAPRWNRALRAFARADRGSIEVVVNENHQHAERARDRQRQMNQGREHNHREPNHPNHLEEKQEAGIEIEEGSGAHNRDFQKDQPQSARNQKSRQLAFALAARELQIRTRAREKNENWRAVMRDPSREK